MRSPGALSAMVAPKSRHHGSMEPRREKLRNEAEVSRRAPRRHASPRDSDPFGKRGDLREGASNRSPVFAPRCGGSGRSPTPRCNGSRRTEHSPDRQRRCSPLPRRSRRPSVSHSPFTRLTETGTVEPRRDDKHAARVWSPSPPRKPFAVPVRDSRYSTSSIAVETRNPKSRHHKPYSERGRKREMRSISRSVSPSKTAKRLARPRFPDSRSPRSSSLCRMREKFTSCLQNRQVCRRAVGRELGDSQTSFVAFTDGAHSPW